ncbi:MAG: lectin, partial [Acidimicrobiales bacterium]
MSEPERIRSAQRWRRSGTLAVTAGLLGACLSTAALAAPASARAAYVSNPAALVNPFIGTTDGGNTFPGADTPFGMIHWSPDTVSRPDGGGYSAVDKDVIGYSLTHLSGPGCPAEGDVPILPTVRPLGRDPEAMTEPLDHHRETASPGYYQSEAGGVNTQLTTTARSGLARFTFPATAAAGSLLFKLADSQTPVSADTFAVVNDQEVEGSVTTGQFCGSSNTYTLY